MYLNDATGSTGPQGGPGGSRDPNVRARGRPFFGSSAKGALLVLRRAHCAGHHASRGAALATGRPSSATVPDASEGLRRGRRRGTGRGRAGLGPDTPWVRARGPTPALGRARGTGCGLQPGPLQIPLDLQPQTEQDLRPLWGLLEGVQREDDAQVG